MSEATDKRASPRKPYERPVLFDLTISDSEGLTSVQQEGSGIDISEHGLGLITLYPLKENEVLRLHLPLNTVKITLPVFAKVVWAISAERRIRAGLKFLA